MQWYVCAHPPLALFFSFIYISGMKIWNEMRVTVSNEICTIGRWKPFVTAVRNLIEKKKKRTAWRLLLILTKIYVHHNRLLTGTHWVNWTGSWWKRAINASRGRGDILNSNGSEAKKKKNQMPNVNYNLFSPLFVSIDDCLIFKWTHEFIQKKKKKCIRSFFPRRSPPNYAVERESGISENGRKTRKVKKKRNECGNT